MALARASSVALIGMEGEVVEIQAHTGSGLPRTVLVGLPDTSLYESRDRCKAAVASAGFRWPDCLLTINLTPATLPKTGSHYDLGITAGVLAAAEVVPAAALEGVVLMALYLILAVVFWYYPGASTLLHGPGIGSLSRGT